MKEEFKIVDLYMQFRPYLLKIAYGKIPNIDICEDLLHDCFVNCIKHFEKIKNMNIVASKRYLSVTMNNLCINYLKKNTKVILVEEENFYDGDPEDENQNVELKYNSEFDYEQMTSSFEKLSERDKCLLMMKYNLRLHDNEIASIFNIKEESVRMATKRAVDKLRKEVVKNATE